MTPLGTSWSYSYCWHLLGFPSTGQIWSGYPSLLNNWWHSRNLHSWNLFLSVCNVVSFIVEVALCWTGATLCPCFGCRYVWSCHVHPLCQCLLAWRFLEHPYIDEGKSEDCGFSCCFESHVLDSSFPTGPNASRIKAMVRYQVMVPEGRQKAVCKGVFGMLMLDTATMSSLSLMEVGWLWEFVCSS